MSEPNAARARRLIADCEVFRDVSTRSLDRLAARSRIRPLSAGEALYRRGTPGEHAFLVVHGRVKISALGPRGNELLLGIGEPGEFFGFVSPLDGGERFVDAVALRASEVVTIHREVLVAVLEDEPRTLMKMVGLLTANLRAAVELAKSTGLLDAQARLWSRLSMLAKRYGSPLEEADRRRSGEARPFRVDHGLSQEDLAASVGVTRVMVNRALRSWRELGFVETGRGWIEFLDPRRLEEYVLRGPLGSSAGGSDEGGAEA